MKKIALIILVALFSCNHSIENKNSVEAKSEAPAKNNPDALIGEGDIIFQSTSGGQGKAIQMPPIQNTAM